MVLWLRKGELPRVVRRFLSHFSNVLVLRSGTEVDVARIDVRVDPFCLHKTQRLRRRGPVRCHITPGHHGGNRDPAGRGAHVADRQQRSRTSPAPTHTLCLTRPEWLQKSPCFAPAAGSCGQRAEGHGAGPTRVPPGGGRRGLAGAVDRCRAGRGPLRRHAR